MRAVPLSSLEEKIARQAHQGQTRFDGSHYITHPEAVAGMAAELFLDPAYERVAWLHDVIEDTQYSAPALLGLGVPDFVVKAVEAMSKKEGEDYELYLRRVKADSIARRVKILDMLHNLSDKPSKNQKARYLKGIVYLLKGIL